MYTCPQGADPLLWKAEIRQHGCPAQTVLVDFHFSCFLLLSLLKLFLCSRSSNPFFLWILLINLTSCTPRQLIFTSVKLKGCKCYLISEEELKMPEVYVPFPRVSAVQLRGIISPYKPSHWIFHAVLLIEKLCSGFFCAPWQPYIKGALGEAPLEGETKLFGLNIPSHVTEWWKRRRNWMELNFILQIAAPCIKKITCQGSKELGCSFPFYQYLQEITHLFMENNELFWYNGDPA